MNEFTKGPWSQGNRGPNGCPIIGNGRGLMIAMIAHSANEPGQEIEAEANAKLVAAAPCLLHALQNLGNYNGQIPDHAWKLVQDAIVKATTIQ